VYFKLTPSKGFQFQVPTSFYNIFISFQIAHAVSDFVHLSGSVAHAFETRSCEVPLDFRRMDI